MRHRPRHDDAAAVALLFDLRLAGAVLVLVLVLAAVIAVLVLVMLVVIFELRPRTALAPLVIAVIVIRDRGLRQSEAGKCKQEQLRRSSHRYSPHALGA